jgi:hypothetical protein
MNGAETWVLSKANELRLGVFGRKILRRIYGPICEGAAWRSRHNEELYRLYDESDLATTVRITRLRWAGHIVRMQDNLQCKKITLDKPKGRRRVGKPNLRWMDGVMRDAERLGVRNWWIKADSHIACRARAAPMLFPCRALIHTCHAVPLPCSDSAVSFVKVRVVAGNIRTASPTV